MDLQVCRVTRDRIFRETAEAIHLIAPGLTGSLLARLFLNPVKSFHLTQSPRFGQRPFCLPKIPICIDTLFLSLFLTALAA